jgi:hypothetical protein
MPLVTVILNALVPIAFVILLGFGAGKLGWLKAESSKTLAVLALEFCLPALLLSATATMPTAEFEKGRFFLGIALGLLTVYLLALGLARTAFRMQRSPAALQALCTAFPNMAFMGVPLLLAVFGPQAVLSVVVGNIISSFVLLPITLTFLEAGLPQQAGRSSAAVLRTALLSALRKPLVWSPLVGMIFAFTHVSLPEPALKSLQLIGNATSGVALFAMGLVLSTQHLRLDAKVLTNTTLKNLVQPAVMALLAVLLGVTGIYRREMILLGAMPTASMTAMFAVRYDVYAEESTATILLSTVLSIGTLGVVIALTR